MLVEGEGLPQKDLDSFRGLLLVGSPIMISILLGTLASWGPNYDLDSFRGHLLDGSPIMISIHSSWGHLLIGSNFFSFILFFQLFLFIWVECILVEQVFYCLRVEIY